MGCKAGRLPRSHQCRIRIARRSQRPHKHKPRQWPGAARIDQGTEQFHRLARAGPGNQPFGTRKRGFAIIQACTCHC